MGLRYTAWVYALGAGRSWGDKDMLTPMLGHCDELHREQKNIMVQGRLCT